MKKHKLLSISAVIMMLSVYGCSLDEFNPSGISTEQEWSTPAGYEKKVRTIISIKSKISLFIYDLISSFILGNKAVSHPFIIDRKSTRLNSSHT